MAKTTKNSTGKEDLGYRRSPYEEWKACVTWKGRAISPALAQKVAKEFEKWMRLKDSISIGDFIEETGIGFNNFYTLLEMDDEFKEIHQEAKELIGCRREKILFKRDPKEIKSTLHLYHRDWKKVVDEEREFRKQLSKEESSANAIKEIQVKVTTTEQPKDEDAEKTV